MGQLVFQATLGGQVNLVGPNTASTFNINVPAVAGNMVTTGDTGTVTNTMLAGSIANAKLTNSSVTIGSTNVALGATAATVAGLTLTNPALGTPASGVLTNCTGLPQTGLAANVAGNGPAFSYYQSVQQTNVTSATWTKVTFTSSQFDTTSGMYSSSRFTPTVAGYYQVNASVQLVGTNVAYYISTAIYKNGSSYSQNTLSNGNSNFYPQSTGSSIVYLNGSTDYIEIYAFGSQLGNWNVFNTQSGTYFNAALIRSA